MKRRNFLKACAVAPAVVLLPQKAKAEQAEVPFLPTLKWLQEYNKDVESFDIIYHMGKEFRPRYDGEKIVEYQPRNDSKRYWAAYVFCDFKAAAHLFWENGKWIAIDGWKDGFMERRYHNQIEWPSWLRRF